MGQDVEMMEDQYNQCLNESQVQSVQSACAQFLLLSVLLQSRTKVWKYFTIKEGVNSKDKKEEMVFCVFCHSSLSCKSNGDTGHLKHHFDTYCAKDPR